MCLFLTFNVLIIPVKLAFARYQAPQPQAILTLGGGHQREVFTAKLAQAYENLDIWVSSGSPPARAEEIFKKAGISKRRIHLDYRAVDTLSNFTSLVGDFQSRDIHHLYLITTDWHMNRAKAIATVVFGSQGIAFTPIAMPSNHSPESWLLIVRDLIRAYFWLIVSWELSAQLGKNAQ